MKIRLTIEVDLPEGMCLLDQDERDWAESDVFSDNGTLILYSNEIGDEIGVVSKVEDVKWVDDYEKI